MVEKSVDTLYQEVKQNQTYLSTIATVMRQMLDQTGKSQVDHNTVKSLMDSIMETNRKANAIMTAFGSEKSDPMAAAQINALNLYNFATIDQRMDELVEQVTKGFTLNLTQENMNQLVDALNHAFNQPLEEVIQGELSLALRDALSSLTKQVDNTEIIMKKMNSQSEQVASSIGQLQDKLDQLVKLVGVSGILVAVMSILLAVVGSIGFIFRIVCLIVGIGVGVLAWSICFKSSGKGHKKSSKKGE